MAVMDLASIGMRPTRHVREHTEPTLDQDKRDDDFGKRSFTDPNQWRIL